MGLRDRYRRLWFSLQFDREDIDPFPHKQGSLQRWMSREMRTVDATTSNGVLDGAVVDAADGHVQT